MTNEMIKFQIKKLEEMKAELNQQKFFINELNDAARAEDGLATAIQYYTNILHKRAQLEKRLKKNV